VSRRAVSRPRPAGATRGAARTTLAARIAVATLAVLASVREASCAAGQSEAAPIALGPPIGQNKPEVQTDSRGYMLLVDGSVHFASDGTAHGYYIAGTIEGGRFIPEGDVQGEAPADDDASPPSGTTGWFELEDGSFCSPTSGRGPARPNVEGVLSVDGQFHPTSRRVNY